MSLLTEYLVEQYAPLIGRVVLAAGGLEDAAIDAYKAAIAVTPEPRSDPLPDHADLGRRLCRIEQALSRLSDAQRAGVTVPAFAEIREAVRDRHHVIHGHWWVGIGTGHVGTRKPPRNKTDSLHRSWSLLRLADLERRLCDAETQMHVLRDDLTQISPVTAHPLPG